MPAERTRIESNPLDRVSELERLALSKPSKPPRKSKSKQPPIAPEPAKLPGMPPSGRFPDAANVPTVIAGGELVTDLADELAGAASAADSGFANLPTHIVTPPVGALSALQYAPTGPAPYPVVPPPAGGFGNAPTALAPDHRGVPSAAPGFGNAPTALAPMSSPENATQIAPMPVGPNGSAPHAPNGGPWHPRPHGSSSSPPMNQPPPGYPVMSAELSEQIATGATVFPSDARGNPGHPMQRSDASASDSFPPMVPPSRAPSPPMQGMHGMGDMGDMQRAANLMSPVGQQYPDQVDWGAAAASRTRAVPPWLLAVLFIGTLGVALAITIVIAKIIR
jgi:hypothetical protein